MILSTSVSDNICLDWRYHLQWSPVPKCWCWLTKGSSIHILNSYHLLVLSSLMDRQGRCFIELSTFPQPDIPYWWWWWGLKTICNPSLGTQQTQTLLSQQSQGWVNTNHYWSICSPGRCCVWRRERGRLNKGLKSTWNILIIILTSDQPGFTLFCVSCLLLWVQWKIENRNQEKNYHMICIGPARGLLFFGETWSSHLLGVILVLPFQMSEY